MRQSIKPAIAAVVVLVGLCLLFVAVLRMRDTGNSGNVLNPGKSGSSNGNSSSKSCLSISVDACIPDETVGRVQGTVTNNCSHGIYAVKI